MIATPDLIDALARNLQPRRRLRPPLVRATGWLLFATLVLTLLSIGFGLRPDLAHRVRDPGFAIGLAASLLTGVLAAHAAYIVSLPDRSRVWLVLPVPAVVVWLSTLGYQCLTHWVSVEPGGVQLGETARCFATVVLTSVPLALAMLVSLRHAALVRPTSVTLMGSVAVAAIVATALSLLHTIDATLMILVWNLGTAALIVGIGSVLSRRLKRG
jgi:hypothetical protein